METKEEIIEFLRERIEDLKSLENRLKKDGLSNDVFFREVIHRKAEVLLILTTITAP